MMTNENKKILYIIIAVVVIFAIVMVALKLREEMTDGGASTVPPAGNEAQEPSAPAPTQATLSGSYVACLPRHDNFSEESCIAGMKADDGSYYALDFNSYPEGKPGLSEGARLTAAGTLTPIEMISNDRLHETGAKGILSVTSKMTIDTKEDENKPQATVPAAGAITIRGKIVCLPHKQEGGMHTMECAFGIKADDGTYYALRDKDPMYKNISSAPMDVPVEVKGLFTAKPSLMYKDIGTIEIDSITKL